MTHPHDETGFEDLTIGGGTAFQELLLALLGQLGGQQTARADAGLGLLGPLVNAELEARRNPIGIIDQLMLGQEFGSVLPLSQLGSERLTQFGIRPSGMIGDIAQSVAGFAQGAIPQSRILNVFGGPNPQILVRHASGATELIPFDQSLVGQGVATLSGRDGPFSISREDLARIQQQQQQGLSGLGPQAKKAIGVAGAKELERLRIDIAGQRQEPVSMAAGGKLIIDPQRRRTVGTSVAGPVRIIDSQGRTAATAGEAGTESLTVQPRARLATQDVSPLTSRIGELSRPEQFRFDDLVGTNPALNPRWAAAIARRPGEFARRGGLPLDPLQQAAWLLAGNVGSDVRFRDPFVRSLSLGRVPGLADVSVPELAQLPPRLQQVLASIMGTDLFSDLLAGAPSGLPGVRRRAIGSVAA